MRKRWIRNTVVFSLLLSLLAPAGHSRAADASVKVVIPDFAVSLNGHKVDNEHREYPLLVYRDITYIPMTWYDTRLLGLEANWSPDNGLNIKQSQVTSSYSPYESTRYNAGTYAAEVPTSVVTINGKAIDNTQEDYPLLTFRDVTYFPLTWRFAHDEFGWDYRWDDNDGLGITSHNPQLQMVGLPAYAGENDVILFRGYYYFVETTGTTNHVYRAPVNQLSDKEEVYAYSIDSGYGLQKGVSFQIRDNTLWFTYHRGGGFMGSDQFVKISDDGKAELVHAGYLDFRDTPYGTLMVKLGSSAFEGGNLYVTSAEKEGEKRRQVGDPNLMYAVISSGSSLGAPNDTASSLAVAGEDAYVIASSGMDSSDVNKLYKINLTTNRSEKIVNTKVSRFRIIDKNLYYVKDEDGFLYSSALDGTGEMKLSDQAVSWFDGLDGSVFYTTLKEAGQFELYQVDSNKDDPLVWKAPISSVQVINGRLVCRYGADNTVVLLDGSGRQLLSVADPISRVFSSDEGMLLQTSKDSSLLFIR